VIARQAGRFGAQAGFVILSTPAVTQTSGCMPANCPGAKEPSTTGQARDKAQRRRPSRRPCRFRRVHPNITVVQAGKDWKGDNDALCADAEASVCATAGASQRGSPYSDVIGCDPRKGAHAAARVHHAPPRRGGVAVRGTRAAPGKTCKIGSPYFGRPAAVSMNEIDLWLERLYWIAMISVPFLAIWAGRIALRQVQTASQQIDAALQEAQTTKLLKILQHVEEQRVQDARHLVMTEIRRQEEEGKGRSF
jgi:hypothetical protein